MHRLQKNLQFIRMFYGNALRVVRRDRARRLLSKGEKGLRLRSLKEDHATSQCGDHPADGTSDGATPEYLPAQQR